jgi:hypothetical protein
MPTTKKRLLVTISYSFSIRYIYRSELLKELSDFCTPVVCLTWNQSDLISELQEAGFEVTVSPENKRGLEYSAVRSKIDTWFKYFRLKSPSKKIQAEYIASITPFKKRLIPKFRELYNHLKQYLPFVVKNLLLTENKLLHSNTNYNELSSYVDSLNIDAVFSVTPFHRQEDILLRVCKDKNKQMLTSILSFDNITKRGWIPVQYDLYIVWNEHNKKQLQRIYPSVKPENIYVEGALQFDFYFKKQFLLEKKEWAKIIGLSEIDSYRKVILYAGGPKALFPHEPDYLKDIDDAICNGQIKGNPVVLFRCHPIDDINRWKQHIGNSKNVIFDKSWTGDKNFGETNITISDIKKLCSTLAYTDLHINLCSTMTVDGSAYNKPQIGPAYYKNNQHITQLLYRMYWQEHFEPIMQTNSLLIAKSKDELIKQINSSLDFKRDDEKEASAKAILESIITYTDGYCMNRVASRIKQYLVNS